MLSTKVAIDIVFVALVLVAIVITSFVIARALTDAFSISLLEQSSEMQAPDLDDTLELTITDERLAAASPADQIATTVYDSSPVILPITWGAVAGTLIWKGKVRSAWSRQGYDYETFRLVTKMRGSPTRIRLLNAVSASPKNKLQLAKEMQVDWKTVNNHIEMLLQSRLVQEQTVVGTTRYYVITHDGEKVLSLLLTADN